MYRIEWFRVYLNDSSEGVCDDEQVIGGNSIEMIFVENGRFAQTKYAYSDYINNSWW